MNEDELASVAAQLVARVRDEIAEDNARWLADACPDPMDQYRLLFVLAAAVPDDLPWKQLTAWTRMPRVPAGTVDEIAIERACHGESVVLTPTERGLAIKKLIARGLTGVQVANRLGVHRRTVERWRRRESA